MTKRAVDVSIERFETAVVFNIAHGASRDDLLAALPAGGARSALDCALWDLEAKQAGKPVWQLVGQPAPKPLVTAYTISFGEPAAMAAAARAPAPMNC